MSDLITIDGFDPLNDIIFNWLITSIRNEYGRVTWHQFNKRIDDDVDIENH